MKRIVLILIVLLSFSIGLLAQKKPVKDTVIQSKTVVVTSAFKPVLKTTAKVNFSAATPSPDTSGINLDYNVPSQNLFFSYQSPALKPLAANIDTILHWENKNFVKAGYGNFTTPYLQAGLSFGDGIKSVVNIHALYTSSKSALNNLQQFSKTNIEALGIFASPTNKNEWNGKLFFENSNQYMYGYLPDTLVFSKDDLRQNFTTFGGKVGIRNKTNNPAGISYNPSLALSVFNDNHQGSEDNFVFNAPMSKTFGKIFAFNLALTGDITSYKNDSITINNNLYYLTPALQFKTPNFKVIAGFTPSWDNNVFSLLPNFSAEAKINDEKFILMAGWTGYFNKTTYQSLAAINPWLLQPSVLFNTRIKEQYAGFKGSAGDHFTYNAKVSYLNFSNQPLFVNDTVTGKSFIVVNESEMKAIRIHGEVGYTMQEKFSFLAGATFSQYSSLQDNLKPWGLLPLELNGALRWQIIKDFTLKSDIYFWDGAQYRNKSLQSQKLQPAVDMNAGVEFTVLPKLNAWVQFNNLFNNKYQRWNQYPVLGFNVLAGIVYSFAQLNTAK